MAPSRAADEAYHPPDRAGPHPPRLGHRAARPVARLNASAARGRDRGGALRQPRREPSGARPRAALRARRRRRQPGRAPPPAAARRRGRVAAAGGGRWAGPASRQPVRRSPQMAIEEAQVRTREVRQTVFVDTFTDGLLGPDAQMLGPVADGGHIVWNSTPGCWGPMITPSIRGGHEVSAPVAVDGAEVGDAVAIRIRDIEVTSLATASGNDQPMEGRFNGDPYCAPVCPGCGAEWPQTRLGGIGQEAVRCASCGADASPFTFTNGYTIAFDELHSVGITVSREAAESFARQAPRFAALPDRSVQHPILTFAPHDIVALATRLRPFMGQLGTSPSTTIPDSHNAGDFGSFLVGAPHRYALSGEE